MSCACDTGNLVAKHDEACNVYKLEMKLVAANGTEIYD
jgi:hypothetical protein